ncbi:hypothetical protein FB45DRAFT_890521 [Roridomyces roridus]|uniref:Uncharacterized protein n=1 Tax=Roridomyces roridus TaxID=1738132 RepID=A0AAD7G341_9AGAR|nr:hypothetical protein FB45DRAFT_890521 [Roridomyces roridus]
MQCSAYVDESTLQHLQNLSLVIPARLSSVFIARNTCLASFSFWIHLLHLGVGFQWNCVDEWRLALRCVFHWSYHPPSVPSTICLSITSPVCYHGYRPSLVVDLRHNSVDLWLWSRSFLLAGNASPPNPFYDTSCFCLPRSSSAHSYLASTASDMFLPPW